MSYIMLIYEQPQVLLSCTSVLEVSSFLVSKLAASVVQVALIIVLHILSLFAWQMPGIQLQSNAQLIDEFDELTRNAKAVQVETLRRILMQNADTEYLQRHGMKGNTDVASFKSSLPLITHANIEEDVQRIADGDKSPILMEKPIEMFSLSSGTTKGRTKLIPLQEEFFFTTMRLFRIAGAYRSCAHPIRSDGKVMDIIYCGKQFTTRGGLKVGTGTTNYFRSQVYELKQQTIRAYNSSPSEVIFCSDVRQAMYCHLLFGLCNASDIEFISSTFVYSIVEAFRMLEEVWKSLAYDIHHGILPAWVTDSAVRAVAARQLHPNPKLSRHIQSECSKGFEGIIPRLWKNAKYVLSIMTGTMEPYGAKMRYYAGALPLIAGDYGASESWIAINLNPGSPPEHVSFTVVPDLAYFEFIPLKRCSNGIGIESNEQLIKSTSMFAEAAPVSLTEVKVGEEYEIVLTTFSGLYRYRLGDVVRITGFHNSTPQFSYVCRKDVLLSIHIDKNGERDLQMVVAKAAPLLNQIGLEVADYTTHADITTSPGHYVMFLELISFNNTTITASEYDTIMQAYCNCVDKSFVDPGYVLSRAAKTISPLELCIVERGTFRKLIQHSLNCGGTFSQYKTPRCIAAPALLDILKKGVTSKYHSVH